MNEGLYAQLHFDFRTGQSSVIDGPLLNSAGRAACAALNRQRARGIMEAHKCHETSQSLTADVWTSAVFRRLKEWEFTPISLQRMGIWHDHGFSCSPEFTKLPGGAEAQPFYDRGSGVVYKFFDLRPNGSLGKKLLLEPNTEGEYELRHCNANLQDTLEKICILHEAGAHATEIAGLSDDFSCLIVKQPFAERQIYHDDSSTREAQMLLQQDRHECLEAMRAVICRGPGFRQTAAVVSIHNQPWLIADLHQRNIMRNAEGKATIIDALVCPVSPAARRALPLLDQAVKNAEHWNTTGVRTAYSSFEAVEDADL